MSQFASGSSPQDVGQRRTQLDPLPSVGITETLNAPGLEIPGFADRGANMAKQMLQILSLSGEAAVQGMYNIREERYQAREAKMDAKAEAAAQREQANQDKVQLHAQSVLEHGNGVQQAEVDAPAILNQIRTNQVVLADNDPKKIEENARALLEAKTQGMTADQQRGYIDHLLPHVMNASVQQKDAIDRENNGLIANELGSTLDAGTGVEQVRTAAEFAGIKPSDVDKNIVAPAALRAVETGDYERAKELASSVPNNAHLLTQIELAQKKNDAVEKKQANYDATSEITAALTDPTTNPQEILDLTKKHTESGALTPAQSRAFTSAAVSLGQKQTANSVNELANNGADPDEVAAALDPLTKNDPRSLNYVPPNEARTIYHRSLQTYQNEQKQQLGIAVQNGAFDTRDDAKEFMASAYSDDPNSKDFLSFESRSQVLSQIKARKEEKASTIRVQSALGGGGVLMNPDEDGKAFTAELNSKGIIDADLQTIKNPIALAQAVNVAQFVPKSVVSTIASNLSSSSVPRVQSAALAAVEMSHEGGQGFHDLFNKLSHPHQMALLTAVQEIEMSGSPQTLTPAAAAHVSQVYQDASKNPAEDHVLKAQAVLDKYRVNVPDVVKGIVSAGGGEDESGNVKNFIDAKYRDAFTVAIQTMPLTKATEYAKEYATHQFGANYDTVTFNGNSRVIPISDQTGKMLSPDLRWQKEFEAEALKDLASEKIDASRYTTMRPYQLPSGKQGWAYVNENDQLLVDKAGYPVVYTPSISDPAERARVNAPKADRPFVPMREVTREPKY